MKTFFKAFLTVLFTVLVLACSKPDKEPAIIYLPVNANNISGDWELVEFNGSTLIEGTYMHITFVRNDKTFVMTQNLDATNDVPHTSTGSFNILTENGVSIIKGKYDYDGGLWGHDYIVTDLTATSMTWTAKDDETFVQKFERPAAK
ncbi:MAG: hypothetical protein ACI4TU_07695 [Candidatus Cryptobacteroides sp.]